MKRIIKVSLVALLLSLTACSAVFDSAISGTVKDKNASSTSSTTTGGIADVMLYAYDNKNDWENKYKSWDGKSVFEDSSVPSARSAQDGSFSISNLRWMTNSPQYGKDADSKTIYLLAFHKDYGLEKVEGRTVQSDKANNFGIIEMEKVTATKTLTITLKDIGDNTSASNGSDETVQDTSGFSFKYTYADGYKTDSNGNPVDNVIGTVSSFSNGKAIITVKYNEKNLSSTGSGVPSVTLYDIQTGSDWDLKETESNITITEEGKKVKVITYDPEKKEYSNTDLKFSNEWKTVTVNISLLDGSSANLSSITDPIFFKWEYNNGEEKKEGNETTETGTSTITVRYKEDTTDPKLTLTSFDDSDDSDDKWTWTESKDSAKERAKDSKIEIKLSSDKNTVTQKVYFRKNYITLPETGISGYLISTQDTTNNNKADGYGYTYDYGDTLILKSEDKNTTYSSNSVTTRQQTIATSATSSIVNYGYFTELASGKKIPVTYNNTTTYQGDDVTLSVEWTKRGSTDPKTSNITINSMTTDFSNFMLYKN